MCRMTEEDTFNALRKLPYDILIKEYLAAHPFETVDHAYRWLGNRGWTYREFLDAGDNRRYL